MKFSWLLACWLWSCAPSVPATPPIEAGSDAPHEPWLADGWQRAETDGGAQVAWRVAEGDLPKNEHFELDVWVLRAGVPITGAELTVRATMPEHGHGMNVEPRALLRPDGSFRVRGMLFHMGGHWELAIHVAEPGLSHSARFDLDVS